MIPMAEVVDATYADVILRIITGILGGALIGLERERAQISGGKGSKGGSIPGLRSISLVSLYGTLSALITILYGGSSAVIVLIAFILGLLMIIMVYAYSRITMVGSTGITTYIVMLIAYLIGIIAGSGLILEAASISILVAMILAIKEPASRLAKALKYDELIAMLEVGVLILVLGPIVQTYSELVPWINVFGIYLFFVAVITLLFASYAAARIWSEKGAFYTLILGSMVNSEAMISALAKIAAAKGEAEASRLTSYMTPLILTVLQLRSIAIILYTLYIFLGRVPMEAVALALINASIVLILAALSLKRPFQAAIEGLAVSSPLEWGVAARSAIAYISLTLVAKSLTAVLGDEGGTAVIALAGIGGLVNANASILSMATIMSDIGFEAAFQGMLLAVASASFNKIIYSRVAGLGGDPLKPVVFWSSLFASIPVAVIVLSLIT